MTNEVPIAQDDLLCSNCAGQCAYAPSTGLLTCQSCGTEHTIAFDPGVDPQWEAQYDPSLPHTEQPRFSQDRPYQCATCGGEVVFQGQSISEQCSYCNGMLVEQPFDESYPALGLIPFSIDAKTAQARALAWISKRWAAPNDLPDLIESGRVAGIYVPFWTFDSAEAVDYTVRYRVKLGKQTYTRTHSDYMATYFDDVLVPASHHVTPLIRDGILHDFRPDSLRPFHPALLAGFAAERHHQSVAEGLQSFAADKRLVLRNRIKRHSGKGRILNVTYKTHTSGRKYRRILLPVWILHYTYNGTPMKVVTCGLRGRTFGERPFSVGKLFLLALGASAAISAFGFVWGALGVY